MDKVFDVVAIGAGPGGISAAAEAIIAGIKPEKVVVLEKSDAHNETVRKFYKHGKRVDVDWAGIKAEFHGHLSFEQGSKEEYLKQFDDIIEKYGIKVVYNHHVYAVEKKGDIFEIAADKELGVIQAKKVVIAIGVMGKPNKPSYKFPGKIRPRLNFNLDKVVPGEKVMIVGGGDTAGEYAYGLKDMYPDCDVTLNYRRAEITRMNPTNKEIVERYIKEGKINSKLGVDVESVEPVENDEVTPPRVKVNFKDGTSEVFDRVVYALGGTTPREFLEKSGIEYDEEKWQAVHNPETMETNVEGLYVVGDVVKGAQSISVAINHGFYAATDIAKKLK
ncbi:MAG: cbb3-type cytochrome oxidase assembly protein CcoS [Nautilia sp.]|nr:MAG: cbb3-type cytochrome oxidase assembly protein CcoS [Nautilia sp.]